MKANLTHVAKLEELWYVDGDGEGERGHQVAPGAPLEGARRARAAAAPRARRALALVHEERVAHRQVPADLALAILNMPYTCFSMSTCPIILMASVSDTKVPSTNMHQKTS